MNRFILEKKYWAAPLVAWAIVVATSFAWNWNSLQGHVQELVINQGRFVFKMVEAVRLWNARHGGVYALVDENTPPNQYLEVPERDIVSPSGRPLTLINPAYMTRQLADAVLEQSNMLVHITSLKPLNPNNKADAWETVALRGFEQGDNERMEVVARGTATVGRYMAPLRTVTACLKCHEKQGYKVGDIRGGIGVTFPIEPLLETVKSQRKNLILVHLSVWALLSALTLLALTSIRRQMLSLQQAKEQQDMLVEQRTSELREEVREREEAEVRLRLLINSSGEGVYGVDYDGRCTFCNPVALRLLGYHDAAELLGKDIHSLIHHSQPDGSPHLDQECKLGLYRDGMAAHVDGDLFWRADGGSFPVEYRCHPIFSEGRVMGAVVTFSDITKRKETDEQIWYQANYDQLTGLPNRSLFQDRLLQAIARVDRDHVEAALLFIDLDGFKAVNDSLGHEAGDLLLQETARRLSGCLRESDTAARMGGDEFTVVLPQIHEAAEAALVADKILERLRQPCQLKGDTVAVTASIGIALYPRDGDSVDTLLKHADHAMYRAKESGRNVYRFYGS